MTTILHRQPPMNGAHKAEDNSAVICRPDQPVSGENRRASMCRSGAYGKRPQATLAEPDSQFWRILLLLISHFTFPCDRFILLVHFIGLLYRLLFWSSCGSMFLTNVFDQCFRPMFSTNSLIHSSGYHARPYRDWSMPTRPPPSLPRHRRLSPTGSSPRQETAMATPAQAHSRSKPAS